MANSIASQIGGTFITIGIFSMFFFPPMGFGCCFLGFICLAIGGMQNMQNNDQVGGAVKLMQDESGQWVWKSETPVVSSFAFNSTDNQILSRVIKEVRDGKSLNQLQDYEIDVLANAYGITSGSAMQKIEALENSELASQALMLTGAGAAAATTSAVIQQNNSIPEPVTKLNYVKQTAEEKVKSIVEEHTSIDAEKVISGDADIKDDIILQQISAEIRKRNLTPQGLIDLADLNRDGELDAEEIAAGLTAMLGMAIPVFIISGVIERFDLNSNNKLDVNELELLWEKLGIEYEEPQNESEEIFSDDEIDKVLEEVDETSIEETVEEEEHFEEEDDAEDSAQEDELLEDEVSIEEETQHEEDEFTEGILSEGIDTEFEKLILMLDNAILSSDRRKILQEQTHQYKIHLRITKFERTLLGEPEYRGGQSVHGIIDGGPYQGVVRIPKALDEEILSMKEGSEITVMGSISDYMPSLKRTVVDASTIG